MSLAESHVPPPVTVLRAERGGAKAERAAKEADYSPAMELADMRELQAISTKLIQEDASGLYDAILDAALKLLHSDMGSMQLYDPVRDGLKLLSSRGFEEDKIVLFDWVDRNAGTSCAVALRSGTRAAIPDIETCEHVVGTAAHGPLRLCGIRGALSTPLVSRSGTVIGMITNHWKTPYEPTERALLLIDVLARQAADLIDRSRNEERIVLLGHEAEHRAKNMLAMVQAVVRLTKADTADELKAAIAGRINALDNVHRLFVASNWTGANLRAVAMEELSPYRRPEDLNTWLSGPDVMLEPGAAQGISMTLHELATNAAKYGALSVPGGQVQLRWSRHDGCINFCWTERGGPPVKVPSRRGVGTKVMESMIQAQLKGAIAFDWRDEGLVCTFSLPG